MPADAPIDGRKGRWVLLRTGTLFGLVGLVCLGILLSDLVGALHDPVAIEVLWAVGGILGLFIGIRMVQARSKLPPS